MNIPGDSVVLPAPESLHTDNLPEVVESVSKAQKQQTMDIEQHQVLLKNLEERYLKEKAKEEALREELRECVRKICLYHEDTNKKKTHCINLEEAIGNAVHVNASLKQELEREQMLREREERLFEEYKEKMQKHVQSVKDMEAEYPENVHLQRQIGIAKDLEEKRDRLKAELVLDEESGEPVAKVTLDEEIRQLQTVKTELKERHNQLEQEISNEVFKQASIKQDIEVLQKRNQAQLTRLKCQVKEAHLRNWQWSQEAAQLESRLQSLGGQGQAVEGLKH